VRGKVAVAEAVAGKEKRKLHSGKMMRKGIKKTAISLLILVLFFSPKLFSQT
jgi:hypothetical protein